MYVNGNGKNTNQDCGLAENEPGITTVRCPFLKTCRFGAMKAKQARVRCRGVLCRVNHWESCLVIGYKCERLRKRILVEVKGNATDFDGTIGRIGLIGPIGSRPMRPIGPMGPIVLSNARLASNP
jgi:hypothetical protein